MAGFFITFEGIDFCGKSVQAQRLVGQLEIQGYPVLAIRDPGTTRVSESIRAILLNVNHQNLCPTTELLLFSAARAQMVDETILPALEQGKIVVCDRFYDSTTAYQGFGRELDLTMVTAINHFVTQGRKPDLTVVLDIAPAVAMERQKLLARQSDRMEAELIPFKHRVRTGFLKIAAQEPERIKVLDGTDRVEVIARRIWDLVHSKISRVEIESGGINV
ncbi:dTMP kinase [candidate division KSB1 bacterium]|nr:dTMP kinase [candidate division KSB1 bacterium]